MDKKGIYICDINEMDQASGVTKKVYGQKEAFRKNGYNITIANISKFRKNSTWRNKILSRFPFFASHYKWGDIPIPYQCCLIYIRKPFLDIHFVCFLRNLKKHNRRAKIFLEIPTYPYIREVRRFFDFPYLLKDLFWTHSLIHYIDYIVVYSDLYKKIYGIPCIGIQNGVDLDSIPLKKNHYQDDIVNLIGVANLNSWHGYDRIIRGIAKYGSQKTPQVHFYIVGDGPAKNYLINLTDKLNLNYNVHFCGPQYGSALDDIFDIADIAIGSIAIYRKGLNYASSLKEKEYCARGIPFITIENKLYEGCDFVIFEKNCSSPVDMTNIVTMFRFKICSIPNYYIKEFALKKLSWKSQIEKIVAVL